MKKGRFLWSAHRITEKPKAGKARNIKENSSKTRAVRSEGCTSCSPVLQALIIFQVQLYGSASAEPFFAAPFPENRGARLRISGGCPARGEPEALIDLCSSIACRAQPCQRCSPVLQALIYLSVHFYGSASAEPFFCCPLSRRTGEHDCASPAVAPQGASRRRL